MEGLIRVRIEALDALLALLLLLLSSILVAFVVLVIRRRDQEKKPPEVATVAPEGDGVGRAWVWLPMSEVLRLQVPKKRRRLCRVIPRRPAAGSEDLHLPPVRPVEEDTKSLPNWYEPGPQFRSAPERNPRTKFSVIGDADKTTTRSDPPAR